MLFKAKMEYMLGTFTITKKFIGMTFSKFDIPKGMDGQWSQ